MPSTPAASRAAPARAAVIDAAVGAAVTALMLAGLARPGFPLLRDWVATPVPPLSDAALGLGESAARAVPQDVAVAWASRALGAVGLPVWPLTGLLAAAFCVWLAVAAGALVRRVVTAADGPGAGAAALRAPAVAGAVWNPLVVERLLQGHWSLLAGVAAAMTMPLLLARARPRAAGAWAALAAAGLTPTGWLLAVVSAASALAGAAVAGVARPPAGRRARAAVTVLAATAVTALPWLLATALAGAPDAPGDTGVRAFAARAEPGIGTLGSVVALGSVWNSAAVPASRATWWAAAALVALLAAWVAAAPELWRARREPVVRATVPLAAVTWALVALAATGPGLAALDALVRAVPAAGLLRDTQKLVALALPATVLALGLAAYALARRLRPAGAALAVATVVVASVPDAPVALWRSLRPVTYGPGWAEVARAVEAGPPGDVLVLPAGSFRSVPGWAGGAAVLDPAPRLLDARVLVPGDLVVGGAGGAGTVAGEGGRAREATAALLRGAEPRDLAALGVRWVLDERASAGPRGESARTLGATKTRYADAELSLHELSGPVARVPGASPGARAAVLAAHAAWLLAGVVAGLLAVAGPVRRLRRRGR